MVLMAEEEAVSGAAAEHHVRALVTSINFPTMVVITDDCSVFIGISLAFQLVQWVQAVPGKYTSSVAFSTSHMQHKYV